ncbi:hypothetical protein [Bacillus halotolerans]|uniref:hypothetical protein n=1 Tax=Bacillus halotolerans TaxID=260554 RepID=UPI0020C2F96A|nr:hypothetical protein [Bacillus halotolerans]UTL74910.1 hypothetical protein NLW79_11735 [Bacillus halotolerans]
MIWAIIVLLVIAAFFIIGDFGVDKQKEIEKQNLEKIISAGNYPKNYKSYLTPDKNKKLTLVESDNKFVIHHFNEILAIEEKSIPFSKIIEAEIAIDDQSITRVSRGSQVAGAVIGGLAAGGIGALVGGLSSDRTESKYFRKIDLKLKLDDFSNPITKIEFLPSKTDTGLQNTKGFKQDDQKVKEALSNVEIWQGIMEIAIRKGSRVTQ